MTRTNSNTKESGNVELNNSDLRQVVGGSKGAVVQAGWSAQTRRRRDRPRSSSTTTQTVIAVTAARSDPVAYLPHLADTEKSL